MTIHIRFRIERCNVVTVFRTILYVLHPIATTPFKMYTSVSNQKRRQRSKPFVPFYAKLQVRRSAFTNFFADDVFKIDKTFSVRFHAYYEYFVFTRCPIVQCSTPQFASANLLTRTHQYLVNSITQIPKHYGYTMCTTRRFFLYGLVTTPSHRRPIAVTTSSQCLTEIIGTVIALLAAARNCVRESSAIIQHPPSNDN